jgi:hypothetical protein
MAQAKTTGQILDHCLDARSITPRRHLTLPVSTRLCTTGQTDQGEQLISQARLYSLTWARYRTKRLALH